MSEFSFVHCADLHLGSRFKGLETKDADTASRFRESVFDSFRRIIDLTIEKADLLIVSGDIYDDEYASPSTRMFFARELARAGVPVFICRGNHDSVTSWDESIPYPSNVIEFGSEMSTIEVSDDAEVIGISYSTQHETRNLVSMLSGSPDRFTIACVHADCESVTEGYPYAPFSLSDLNGKAVDYWALGHIHKRDVVSRSPYAIYPGNIQGRSFRETGEKGAYLVKVSSRSVVSCDFIPTQTFVWNDVSVDIGGKTLEQIISDLKCYGKNDVCRITFTGSGDLNTMLRTEEDEFVKILGGSLDCTVSSIIVDTVPFVDIDARAGGNDITAAVIKTGRGVEALTKDEIIDIICTNKPLAAHREYFASMSEESIRSLVEEALRSTVTRLEAMR